MESYCLQDNHLGRVYCRVILFRVSYPQSYPQFFAFVTYLPKIRIYKV